MDRKEFLQGYRSFMVWAICIIITAILLFMPDVIGKAMPLLHWLNTANALYLGRNVIKHGIERRYNGAENQNNINNK